MSQQKHTPGPYSYGEDNDGWYLESESVKAKLGHGDQIAYCLSEDDARRISACLNACEGVSTDRLENNLPIVELVGRHSEALCEIEALKTGQAELLEALEALVNDFGRDGYGVEFEDGECRVIDMARAAIARATRGGK